MFVKGGAQVLSAPLPGCGNSNEQALEPCVDAPRGHKSRIKCGIRRAPAVLLRMNLRCRPFTDEHRNGFSTFLSVAVTLGVAGARKSCPFASSHPGVRAYAGLASCDFSLNSSASPAGVVFWARATSGIHEEAHLLGSCCWLVRHCTVMVL